jgi:hypothetical protein
MMRYLTLRAFCGVLAISTTFADEPLTEITITSGSIPARHLLASYADLTGAPLILSDSDLARLDDTVTVVAPISNATDAVLQAILEANGWRLRSDILNDGRRATHVHKNDSKLDAISTAKRNLVLRADGDHIEVLGLSSTDRESAPAPGGERILRLLDLRHRKAEEIADLVNRALSGDASESPSELPNERLPMLVADGRTNKIILSGHGKKRIDSIALLVRELDVPAPDEPVRQIYSVKAQRAPQLESLLNRVYGAHGGVPPPTRDCCR